MHVGFLDDRGLASLEGIVCAMCGTWPKESLRVPSFASVFASALLKMYVCDLTFCIVILCWNHVVRCIMKNIKNLSRCYMGGWSSDVVVYVVFTIEIVSKYVDVMGDVLNVG